MVSEEDVWEARERLNTAERRFDTAGEMLNRDLVEHPGSVVTSSQRCIEQSAKAVFLLMGVYPPNEHAIPLDSEPATQLLNAAFDEFDEWFARRVARLVFLTQVWGNAYPTSEYGVQVDLGNLEADEFLDLMEADQAYNHADAAVSLARGLIADAGSSVDGYYG